MISDVLVFNKIKNRLGGRVRVIVTGGCVPYVITYKHCGLAAACCSLRMHCIASCGLHLRCSKQPYDAAVVGCVSAQC